MIVSMGDWRYINTQKQLIGKNCNLFIANLDRFIAKIPQGDNIQPF
jgi:hypothetical protein